MDINETIRKIIDWNLFAPTASRLSDVLGYEGRSSIGRIRKGLAGSKAIMEFCGRMESVFGIDEAELLLLGNLIEEVETLSANLKKEIFLLNFETRFKVICCFIDEEYTSFTKTFKEEYLNHLMSIKSEDKDLFFFMLSLFLFKGEIGHFYKRELSFQFQLEEFLDPLRLKLKERYPLHFIGLEACGHLYESPLARFGFPILATALRIAGIMIMGFCSNFSEMAVHDQKTSIPGLPNRSFWKEVGNSDKIIFLKYDLVNNSGNGQYEYYVYNLKKGETINPAQIYIWKAGGLSIFLKESRFLMSGNFEFDGSKLMISLDSDNDEEENISWELLNENLTEVLKELNLKFTDVYLKNITYKTLGLDTTCGVFIRDVMISKKKLILITSSDEKYMIDRDKYPFLKEATPDMEVLAYRDSKDSKIYLEWIELGCRIDLDMFKRIN